MTKIIKWIIIILPDTFLTSIFNCLMQRPELFYIKCHIMFFNSLAVFIMPHSHEIKLFLDALASLVLMIDTNRNIDSEIGDWRFYTTSGHSKWNVTQNGMSLKMECHSKWNVTQNGVSLKTECHSKLNVTQNGMLLKMEYHFKWNVTQN